MAAAAPATPKVRLTPIQKTIWLGQRFLPDHPIYNTAYAFHIGGELDLVRFERAHAMLVDSTDSLRLRFGEDQEGPFQSATSQPSGTFRIEDARGIADEALNAKLTQDTATPFDLSSQVWRSVLYILGGDKQVWHLVHHHLATDGIGFQIIFERMAQCYQATDGNQTLKPVPQFLDWASLQPCSVTVSENHHAKPSNYFSKLFSSKSPSNNPSGQRHALLVPESISRSFRALAENEEFASFSPDLSLSLLFYTAAIAVLHRIEQRTDLCIGIVNHGRLNRQQREIAGPLVALQPLAITIEDRETFKSLHEKVRAASFGALAQSTNRKSERSKSNYDVVINFLTGSMNDFAGLPTRADWLYGGCHEPANRWRIHVDNIDRSAGLRLLLDYSDNAFGTLGRESAQQCLLNTLNAFAADPTAPLSHFPLLSATQQRDAVLATSITENSSTKTLWEQFYESATRFSENVAIETPDESISYGTLSDNVDALHAALTGEELPAGVPIPILTGQGSDLPTAALAVIKRGHPFLPVDPELPNERIAAIVADSQSPIVLANRANADRSAGQAKVLRIQDLLQQYSNTAAERSTRGETAYIIYTSGSTGTPNGVSVGHNSVSNLLADMEGRAPLLPFARGLWWTAVGFDVSIYELFSTLLFGRTLCLPPREIRLCSVPLFEWLQRNQIDLAYLPPFMLRDLDDWLASNSLPSLRRLLVGVEPIPQPLLASIERKLPQLRIVNGYGPTEATVCATFFDIADKEPPNRRTPIGRPLQGNGCYVLDQWGNLMPRGAIGELYLSGAGLAQGYWRRPKLTNERFQEHAFDMLGTRVRLYRTGDLVRETDDEQL